MDNWENIKEALKLTGGKYVLAEKGEPSYVIVELDEYVDLLKRNGNGKKEIGKLGNWEIEDEEKHISKNPPDPLLQRGNYQERSFQEENSSTGLENLSERGLIEKINGSINVWKDLQDKRMLKKMEVENATGQECGDSDSEAELEEDKIVIEKI